MQKPLFIFEMANNHMGDVNHGVAIIQAMRQACMAFSDRFDFAFKLQYRQLDTFIHPSFHGRDDVPYVKRFEETRLSAEQFGTLLDAMRSNGFQTMCTPFDEASVDLIDAQGIDRIKIASCSLTDWPLLERIARSHQPVVASTAGASPEEVDNVVSFFGHRQRDLCILHCVAEYPTPDAALHIERITALRQRYPEIRIGFSTHEAPERTEPVMLALAKGACVFEKHVGLPSERYPLNAYSANPAQVQRWLAAAALAQDMLGDCAWPSASAKEQASLTSLRRGVFIARPVAAGTTLGTDDVCFAFPPVPGQITANEWSKYTRQVSNVDLQPGSPLLHQQVTTLHDRGQILAAVMAVRQLLQAGNIVVPGQSELEISHHYGMEHFAETGLTMITVVNREYCKKLIVMLPGQTHPEQFHQKKEETFVILHGSMSVHLDGVAQTVQRGDILTVQRGVRHRFHSADGVVFEEISSTHHADDSYYTDPAISANLRRKTHLTYWL